MNAETFFKHFETFAEAPNGVAKLREMILQLAVQGKLVSQDPDDEPALVVISRIAAQKNKLLEGGDIQMDKKFSPIAKQQPPWSIPSSWQWVRLQDIFVISRGGSPRPAGDPQYFGGAIPWITVGEITKNEELFLTNTSTGLTELGSRRSRFIDPGDLLITNSGATLGVPKISRIRGCINDGVALLKCHHSDVVKEYAYLFLRQQTQAFRNVNQGMGQPNLNTPILAGWYFAFPPLKEQKRIVSKVDQLMKLCDALESRQTARRESRMRLVGATLDRVVSTSSTAEFPKHVNRLRDQFDRLFDTPTTIPQLRQTILQLAVQGKLVPQDPNDEPAETLFNRIVLQKDALIAEKTIRRSNSHTSRDASTDDYSLPTGWVWVTLDDVTDIGTGGTPPTATKEYYEGGTIPWITSSATNSQFIEQPEQLITENAVSDCRLKIYPRGSLVVALYGQGKTRGQVGELMFDSTCNQACAVIRFFCDGIGVRNYTRLVFRKKYHELRELAAGGAQPNLNGGMIRLMKVPLPPLAEQNRIVAKVNQLMKLCDGLESQLSESEIQSTQILSAAVHHLLNASSAV
jgi:type I restriction enzyme S subunit